MRSKKNRYGFTLIELLVVIAIIAILAAILFPVFSKAKDAARQSNCQGNLRQIGFAFSLYCQNTGGFYPLGEYYKGTKAQPGGPYKQIFPYTKNHKVFECPSAIKVMPADYWPTYRYLSPDGVKCSYTYNAGVQSTSGPGRSYADGYGLYEFNQEGLTEGRTTRKTRNESEIRRPSGMLLMADGGVSDGCCWSPAAIANQIDGPGVYGVWYYHSNKCNVVFCDGHVKAMPNPLPETIMNLNGKELH